MVMVAFVCDVNKNEYTYFLVMTRERRKIKVNAGYDERET